MFTTWVRVCAAVKWHLSVSDCPAISDFVKDIVKNGGAVSMRKALTPYLKDCFQSFRRGRLVFYDETDDSLGCFVGCVHIAPSSNCLNFIQHSSKKNFNQEPFNDSKVKQQVMSTFQNYEASESGVVGFCTDNAAYMFKSHNAVLRAIIPNCQQLTC